MNQKGMEILRITWITMQIITTLVIRLINNKNYHNKANKTRDFMIKMIKKSTMGMMKMALKMNLK